MCAMFCDWKMTYSFYHKHVSRYKMGFLEQKGVNKQHWLIMIDNIDLWIRYEVQTSRDPCQRSPELNRQRARYNALISTSVAVWRSVWF